MSIQNIFHGEVRKIFCDYPFLSGAMNVFDSRYNQLQVC